MRLTVARPGTTVGAVGEPRAQVRRRFPRVDATGRVGALLLVIVVLACLGAPLLTTADPTRIDLPAQFQGPSLAHPFGTDNFGRDLFARILYGGRVSLGVAMAATTVVLAVSVLLGTLAGYLGGVPDGLVMRAVDLTLAFPRLVLAIAIAGTLGVGIWSVAIAIVAVSWAWYARLVRGMVLQVREEPYVVAARSLGGTTPRLLRRHILPALGGRIAVLVTLDFGYLILNISALSFLGLGVQQPTPEWGAMLSEGRLFFAEHPQLLVYPGLAIFATVLAANLVGDALRDALDPRRAAR